MIFSRVLEFYWLFLFNFFSVDNNQLNLSFLGFWFYNFYNIFHVFIFSVISVKLLLLFFLFTGYLNRSCYLSYFFDLSLRLPL